MRVLLLLLVGFIVACLGGSVRGADWPQWRYDAGHTASAPSALPDRLALQWTHQFSARQQVWDDPLNNDLMQYDRIFEPVVKDGRLFVNFNDADKVVAIDVATGDVAWTFYTDGPVRFPAVAWRDVVFFSSDDGHLYCVNAADGTLKWKFQGAPGARKVIGNQRLISAWPARGGPVLDENDEKLYFAASIWPFMGTFIYCLDAASGQVVWVNDGTASQYIKQPHSAPSFAGVAPQGCFTLSGDTLLVPGGRSVPAALDRHTGQLKHFLFNEGGKGNGGSLVLAKGSEFYVHTRLRGVRAFDLESGNKTAFMTNEPVLYDSLVFAAESLPADQATEIPVIRAYGADKQLVWEVQGVDGSGDMIQAGSRLYAAGGGQLTALEFTDPAAQPSVAWQTPAPADIQRLIAAADRLFAVTLDGQILCYAQGSSEPIVIRHEPVRPTGGVDSAAAEELVRLAGTRDGLVLAFGDFPSELVDSALEHTGFELVMVVEDPARAAQLRRHYDAAGKYGRRISVQVGNSKTFQAPPYVANLVVLDSVVTGAAVADRELLRRAYESVRPYGGCLVAFAQPFDRNPSAASGSGLEPVKLAELLQAEGLEQAEVQVESDFVVARRVGALPGAADWTHQYGDIANTLKSNDARVRLPLGLLWFGGSSNLDVLPRHGHGPPEQVVEGRLFIEGMNSLSCRDVYTGRVLWKRTFDDLGTFEIYFDDTYKDTPLDPAYNQVHIPGANGRGTNYVATKDAVYLVEKDICHVIDPETGETRQQFRLPEQARAEGRQWAFVGVYENVLLGGAGFANYRQNHKLASDATQEELSGNEKGYGLQSLDSSASLSLVAYDRHHGDVLWQVDARHSFLHNGIVAGNGKVFCLDKLPQPIEDRLRRRGRSAPDTYRIISLDAQTGDLLWEQTGNIFGTWLGYSDSRDLLLHAGAAASDRLKSEVGQGMAVYRGGDGQLAWRVDDRQYSGPCILHHDTILTNANAYQISSGAFNLLDGSPSLIRNPVTNEEQTWQLCRAYGCNNIIASENLLTFRSGAAGFYDMETLGGTGNLGGFKSGCTSNLVVANGVLNAPDYTRTCSCGYQNQTSLALVHMPEMEMWTINHTAQFSKPGDRIQRIGINFGAPGDRMHPDGTLWIDYPPVGGESLEIDVKVEGDPVFSQRNSLGFTGPAIPWIGASAMERARKIAIPLSVKGAANELRFRVQRSEDDAEEQINGQVSLTSTDLELVTDQGEQTVGVRFDGVSLLRGQKIESAYLQFTCDEATAITTGLELAIEDSAHALPFRAAAHNISARSLLPNRIRWNVPVWEKVGRAEQPERSPEVTALVEQIIQRADWNEGNAVAFIVSGVGSRVAKSFDGGASLAPELVVRVPAERDATERPSPHTVKLYFAEGEEMAPGERVFDILIQDQPVETDFDVAKLAGGSRNTIVREYANVMLVDELSITLKPKQGEPVISGVEIIRQP